jgi:hypothetical protein
MDLKIESMPGSVQMKRGCLSDTADVTFSLLDSTDADITASVGLEFHPTHSRREREFCALVDYQRQP